MSQTSPLSVLMWSVAQARARFEHGSSIATLLPSVLSQVSDADRGTVQAIVYESFRYQGLLDALMPLFCPRRPAPLITGLIEGALVTLWMKRYKPFVVIDQTVQAAKSHRSTERGANLINAILRRYLREEDRLLRQVQYDHTVKYNLPSWWLDKLKATYPKAWESVTETYRLPPPLTLRVNVRKTTPEAMQARWEEAGIKSKRIGKVALMLDTPCRVDEIPGFKEGFVSVQDAGTQWATEWLPVKDGDRVLDACAAPGGKTAHLLERANVDVTAIEIDPLRTPRIHENLDRLELKAKVITADATDIKSWWDGQPYDAILLDAPCTASGVVRRQPDTPWCRKPDDIKQLAKLQAQLLESLWPLLRPNGYLLYTTCSVFPEEGVQQIDAFLSKHKHAQLVPLEYAKEGKLTLLPHHDLAHTPHGAPTVTDGFFYALLTKTDS